MNEINDRIIEIIDVCFEGNLNRACREFGISQSTMINIVKLKRNKPSYDNIIKMVTNKRYNINVSWLILGVGEMFSNMPKDPAFFGSEINVDYKQKYEDAKDEIIRLHSKLNLMYERQHSVKEDYPSAMGNVKGARAS